MPTLKVVLHSTRAGAAAAALALVMAGAVPAGALAATTTTSAAPSASTTGAPSTSTTSPAATSTSTPSPTTSTSSTSSTSSTTSTTALGLPDAGALGLEVPTDEATLLALVDEVHGRLLDLQSQIANLDGQLAQNALALQGASTTLSTRQDDLYQAQRHVDSLEVDAAAARISMRDRAVAAYMHQPTGDLANMLLHLEDPSALVDARSFYKSLVDVESQAIQTYDHLTADAKGAVRQAAVVRDAAIHQRQAVSDQRQQLDTLKQTLQQVQASSQQQAADQARLLLQVGNSAGKFAAEIAKQVAESSNIEQLLASVGTPGGAGVAAPGGGFFTIPVPGAPITQLFGPSHDPFTGATGFHPGIDFGATVGTPIHAAGDGVVVFAGVESGYGNYTCISHGNSVATCYAHQSALLVKVGDQVKRGQIIGLVGSTGYSTGPHLHFEVRINGAVTDPLPWLIAAAPKSPK